MRIGEWDPGPSINHDKYLVAKEDSVATTFVYTEMGLNQIGSNENDLFTAEALHGQLRRNSGALLLVPVE